jgi:hypothetical protein
VDPRAAETTAAVGHASATALVEPAAVVGEDPPDDPVDLALGVGVEVALVVEVAGADDGLEEQPATANRHRRGTASATRVGFIPHGGIGAGRRSK